MSLHPADSIMDEIIMITGLRVKDFMVLLSSYCFYCSCFFAAVHLHQPCARGGQMDGEGIGRLVTQAAAGTGSAIGIEQTPNDGAFTAQLDTDLHISIKRRVGTDTDIVNTALGGLIHVQLA